MFAHVIAYHHVFESVDTLTYRIPEGMLVKAGDSVQVPFGSKEISGIVIELSEISDLKEIKDIFKVLQPQLLNKQHIAIAKDLAIYYGVRLYRFIQLFLPTEILNGEYTPSSEFFVEKGESWENRSELISGRAKKQFELIKFLENNLQESLSYEILKNENFTSTDVKKLTEKNIVKLVEHEALKAPYLDYKKRGKVNFELGEAQGNACREILANATKPQLLFGITGSGKTEVYIRTIQNILANDPTAQVIVLVPEINLTPQLISRFRDYFDDLSIWHSKLSRQQKLDEWQKIARGNTRIIIGSRSALFTPFQNLKALFLDEEHDHSYKQAQTPRYDAHTVAECLQKYLPIHVVYGSATPKVETYYQALSGMYGLSKLPTRFENRELPPIILVDLTQEKLEPKSFLSYPLQLAIRQRLDRKEQVLLFLNRRGFASSLTCKDCGWFHECTNCDVATTIHLFKERNYLTCHCCGKHYPSPLVCPNCESLALFPLGSGTQKIEEELKTRYPDARILRIDQDTTRTKDSHRKIDEQIHNHEADIIVGTQMIGKGLDVANVTLVGIVLADYGLHIPDFRAEETSFQTLSQVSGRAGRKKPGKVILQTLSPRHPVIIATQQHDYQSMYESAIAEREKYNYPPFCEMVKLEMVHPIFETCKAKAQKLAEDLRAKVHESRITNHQIDIIGPSPALVVRQHNKFHYHILLKFQQGPAIEEILKTIPHDWIIDRNPYSIV